jgi:WD40 repeat protein
VRELDVGEAGAFAVDFSPDGEVLAIGGWEPVVTLWDVATGAQIGSSLGAGNGRAAIDLSPDGGRLLLTRADGRGAIYDVDPDSWARRACMLAKPHLDGRRVGGVPSGAAVRTGLRILSLGDPTLPSGQ